jgi:hypothetical protein
LLVIAFEAVEEGEKDVVGCMGVGGGMMNGCKLGRRECADGCMRVWTREEDGKRGEEIWGIIETVYDIVLGGGDGCRAHVWWWVVVTLWEERASVVLWRGLPFTSQIEAAFTLIIYIHCPSIARDW